MRVAVHILLVSFRRFSEAYDGVDDLFAGDGAGGEHVPASACDAPPVPAGMIAVRLAARPGEDQDCIVEVGFFAKIQGPTESPRPPYEGDGAAVGKTP